MKTTTEQYPAKLQLRRLGLNENIPYQVLDIACGRDAKLVEYLRKHGINAEGIDPLVNASLEYLMAVAIGESPDLKIPRKNNTYDLVVAHENPHLSSSLSSIRDATTITDSRGYEDPRKTKELLTRVDACCDLMLHEALRVVKPGAKIIIWPSLDRIERAIPLIKRLGGSIIKEDVGFRERQNEDDFRLFWTYNFDTPVPDSTRHRTIITKSK